jgi:hypothetical protein
MGGEVRCQRRPYSSSNIKSLLHNKKVEDKGSHAILEKWRGFAVTAIY